MNKLILKIVAVVAFLLLLTFNITTVQNSTEVTLGGTEALATGNIVDCYSTFNEDPWWWEDMTAVYDCGPCTQVTQVSDWTDAGLCEYTPAPVED